MRDSCGSCGTGETPQTQSVEEAHRPPHGKRAAWSSNQQPLHLLQSNNVYENSLILKQFLPAQYCPKPYGIHPDRSP